VNRRLNTVVFLVGATVLNILLLFFYFLTFQGVTGIFLPDRTGFLAVVVWIGLFLAALVAGWFTYRWAFRVLKEHFPLDKYLDPNLFRNLF